MLKSQNYQCVLCETKEPLGVSNTFVVDHDHDSGKVRGLLCNHCNTGIGKLKDCSTMLRKAADYIDNTGFMDAEIRKLLT
jgi:hypothetical protein